VVVGPDGYRRRFVSVVVMSVSPAATRQFDWPGK